MRNITKRTLAALTAALLIVTAVPGVTIAQIPVIDATNLVQTTTTALKMVESVLNELEMISNQIKQMRT